LDAKSRPTFKEIVQQLEEAIAFPLTVSSNLSGSRRCPVVTTRSNPCSTAMIEARSEEFLLQNNGPEENNHKKCTCKSIILLFNIFYSLHPLISIIINNQKNK
jgi:hypothetical protein